MAVARGPSLCVSTACATGNYISDAPGDSLRDADLILAGGAEASILPIGPAASWS